MNVSECDSFNECHNSENVRLDSGCTTCHVVGWPDKYTDNARTLEFTQTSSQCTAFQDWNYLSPYITVLFVHANWLGRPRFIHFSALSAFGRVAENPN